jgi:inhibitor of cysteine peptidase
MERQHRWVILAPVVFLVVVAACTAARETSTPMPGDQGGEVITGQARVEEIEILILESFPVQVNVVARGNLPDGCTTIDQTEEKREGNTFLVTITTVRPPDRACTEALVPFEEVISLDVAGLAAGTYTVDVNRVRDTFELAVDNKAPPS